jgi:hypothetical protein
VTVVRLVREAEIELRRPRLHLIPLELRSLRPRPITLVSLQGRLPNLHRLRSPAIHNDSWMLRTRRLTDWKITVFKCNKSSVHLEQNVFSDAQSLWALGVLGFVLARFLSQRLRGGLLSNDKSRALTRSSHQLMVEGGGYL